MTVSALFKYIEHLHVGRSWGRFLDVGTGVKSLQWISSLDTLSWTAVTASSGMAVEAQKSYPKPMRASDSVIVGNWVDESLLKDETFDTVLVDYFVGAVDGYSPYWQDLVFERFRPLVTGRMYVTAVEPYVLKKEKDPCGLFIGDLGRFRDAFLLMVGQRPYREYPSDWVMRALHRAGFRPIEGRRFPIRYGASFVQSQLGMCRDRLHLIESEALRQSLNDEIARLEARGQALISEHGGIPYGFDYVIAAEPRN